MLESQQPSEVNLVEFLCARARNASDARLALDAAIGLIVAVIAFTWRPAGWYLVASAAICFAAFGGWGIADRELRERRVGASEMTAGLRILGVVRISAAAIGILAAIALLVALLGVALGTWIS